MLPAETVTRRRTPADRPAAEPVVNVVLDTNTVLDWLLFAEPAARAVGEAIVADHLRWLATPRMLAELRAVLGRRLADRWESARELALTIDVAPWATMCDEPDRGRRLVCRDRADQMFIDLACAHGPSLLLTRDRALLALRRRAAAVGVQVATAQAWFGARATGHAAGAPAPGPR